MEALNFDEVRQSLQQWIDALPLVNPVKASELIYNKLAELPFQHLQPIEYFQLLEMIKPPIHLLYEVLQEQFSGREVYSILEYSRQTALTISLLMRYASGYTLLSTTNSNDKLSDGMPLAAMCIYRAICNLSRVIVISYQLYTSPPTQIWLRLHKLFLQAEKNGYTTMILSQNPNEPSTISDAYKVCMLLSCANPHQLRGADIIKLYTVLLQWAHYAEIVSQNPEHTAITFLLDEDEPPSYQVLNQHPATSPFLRGLNTKHLIEHISASIKQHDGNLTTHKAALSQHALRIIAKAWSDFSKRVMERSSRQGNIEVTLGLTSTHTHITGDKPLSQFEPQKINERFTSPSDSNIDGQQAIAHSPSNTDEPDNVNKYPVFDWQIINVSPQGYCLQTSPQSVPTFETGDLVGLHQISQQVTHWRIGTIRWIKKINNLQFQVGVMIIGPSVVPVAVQIGKNTSGRYFRGLILPELYSTQKANTIIMPALNLPENKELMVFYNKYRLHIKIADAIYLNDKFYQFKYDVIENFSAQTSNNADKSNLKNIWDYQK